MRNLFLASATAATLLSGLSFSAPAFAQAGSFQGSCRNTNSSNGMLTAECADGQGRFHFSSIPYTQCKGDIGNSNGSLVCNGATASGGQIVGGNNGGNDNRGNNNRGRDNTAGAALGGLAVGALLGGALAGNGGVVVAAPPPPPAYGDTRYGDPRYDWRYQQGGYGYGRRQGEWISIRDRSDWLNRQIDQLQRSGRIDYRDARDYRRQLNMIQDRERNYMRDGRITPRERNDLDRQFNQLTDDIRRDARDD
jgi:hypothetical protein